jgi:hypothetical protein
MDIRLRTDTRAVRDFSFTDEPAGPLVAAARRAVLWPIGTELGLDASDGRTVAATLLQTRRDVIDALAAAGVPSLQQHNRRMLALNCWPSMVGVEGWSTLVCKRRFCPWCHGREVERLAAAVGLDDAGRREGFFRDGTLSLATLTTYLPAEAGQEGLRDLLAYRAGGCAFFARAHAGRFVACYWAADADPHPVRGRARGWRVQGRVLGVRPSGTDLVIRPEGWALSDCDRPGAGDLAEAACQVSSYPLGNLFGDIRLLAQALAAREGLRLAGSYGAFRHRQGVGTGQGHPPEPG